MLTGSCLCQAVAYEVDADPGPFVHCHCRTCRKTHASAPDGATWFDPKDVASEFAEGVGTEQR
jgi:hypothetical protein